MTSPNTGELVARATYMVGNPSAWDNYDEGASAVIDQLVAALERLKEALGHHERLLLVNSVRNAAQAEAPLWLEAADHAAESVRAQVEERKP